MMLGNVTAMKRPGSTSSLQNELAFRPSSAERTLIASLAFPFSAITVTQIHKLCHTSGDGSPANNAILPSLFPQVDANPPLIGYEVNIHQLIPTNRKRKYRHSSEHSLKGRVPSTVAQEATDGGVAQDLQLIAPWHHQALVTGDLLENVRGSAVPGHPEEPDCAFMQPQCNLFQLTIQHICKTEEGKVANTFFPFLGIRRRPLVHVPERQEERGRHGPQRAHRYPARRAGSYPPSQVGVGHDGVRLPLQSQPIQQPLDGLPHLGVNGLDEADGVGAAAALGGDDVGDGG
ncbi:hypothetical protein U9M48_017427 [Paspalum notatum var. saurae]|uniref:Uncharacterized protein n=1 Tax=Paspalum notatum var. saurae TaxID=547442 RepID=A0AAQ3T7W9_PASNO